jgi:deazaflavin-dependent oxidoreductase (nitroreductase family)
MLKAPLVERISVWMEVEILSRLTPKDGVGPVFKWIFKIPILYYKLGLGWMLEKRFLLLTTTGRKSGKPRHTPLEFVHNPQDDSYRVLPGWGGNTDWYKNLRHNPHVNVQVGRRKFAAVAETAPDEEAAEFMMNASHRHPSMDKVWNRWSDKPVDGTLESYVHAARWFPSVRLKPMKEQAK